MNELAKKITQLRDVTKSLLAKPNSNSLVPALKLPSPKPLSMPSTSGGAPSKLPGAAIPSGKDPKAMAAQLKNPRPTKPKIEVMKTDSRGQWSLDKVEALDKGDEQHYRIHVDGSPVTKPMPLNHLQTVHGSVKSIEANPGHLVVPHNPAPKLVKDDSSTMTPDGNC